MLDKHAILVIKTPFKMWKTFPSCFSSASQLYICPMENRKVNCQFYSKRGVQKLKGKKWKQKNIYSHFQIILPRAMALNWAMHTSDFLHQGNIVHNVQMWWFMVSMESQDLWKQSHSSLILLPSQSSETGFDPRIEASLFIWNRYSDTAVCSILWETALHGREQSQEEPVTPHSTQ